MAEPMPARLRRWAGSPWVWGLVLFAPTLALPAIDIGLSAWFYDPVRQIFPLRVAPLGDFVRKTLPLILFALAVAVAGLGGLAAWRRRPVWGVRPRVALYLLAVLALGPGLVVNVVFKDNWGRPRPSTIAEFGGPNQYVRPLVPSTQCDDNCSFPSGHAALGFWAVAFALLAPRRLWPLSVGAALAFGGLVGLARIAQGGHFASDVLASALLVGAVSRLLHRVMIERPVPLPWKNNGPSLPESP